MDLIAIQDGLPTESVPPGVANADEPTPPRKRPRFRVTGTDEAPRVAIAWRHPNANIELAEALGAIAADLWIAGKVTLD